MTTSIEHPPAGIPDLTAARAADHLWMHFARQGRHPETPVPVITRGEGAFIWDNQGRKILDDLSHAWRICAKLFYSWRLRHASSVRASCSCWPGLFS